MVLFALSSSHKLGLALVGCKDPATATLDARHIVSAAGRAMYAPDHSNGVNGGFLGAIGHLLLPANGKTHARAPWISALAAVGRIAARRYLQRAAIWRLSPGR